MRCVMATGDHERTAIAIAKEVGILNANAPSVKVGVGLGRSSHGGAAVRAVCCLAGTVGSFDKLGGGVLYDTGCEFHLAGEAVTRPDWLEKPTRTLNMTDLAVDLEEWNDPPHPAWRDSRGPKASIPESHEFFKA